MSSTFTYTAKKVTATPRNKRYADAVSASGGSSYVEGGSDFCYWKYVTTVTDADGNVTDLDSSAYYLESLYKIQVDGDITSDGTVRAAGDVQAGSIVSKDLASPIAGYSAIGYSRFDSSYFTVDADGLVHIKDSVLASIDIITTSETEASTDSNVYSAAKIDTMLSGIDSKPTALWLENGTDKYIYYTTVSDVTLATLVGALHVNNYLDVAGNSTIGGSETVTGDITSDGTVRASGDVQAGSKVSKDLTSPIAGYTAIGYARYDSDDFTVDSDGQVHLKTTTSGAQIVAQATQPANPAEGLIWIQTAS